jgi:hypothetical protein
VAPRKRKPSKPSDIPPELRDTATKADQDLLARWKTRVARAQKIRKDWEVAYKVEKCERYFLGMQGDRGRGDQDTVFNHTWATIKTQRPNLFYTQPKFFVRSKPGRNNPTLERDAAIGEATLESVGKQDDNLKRAGSLGVLQNYFRIGVLKTVYDPRMEPNPRAGEPIYNVGDTGEPIVDELGQAVQMRDPATGEPLVEPEEVLTDEAYRYEWVDGTNMLLPDEGPDRSKWSWVGEEIVVPLEDAKQDTRFSKSLRSRLVANESTSKLKHAAPLRGDMASSDDEKLRYYELYDIKQKRVRVLADGQEFEDFLMDEPLPHGVEDHPYALLLGWTPILGPEPSPWPMPHIRPWLDIQREYNIRRQQITEGAKRSARKGIYFDGSFDNADEAVKALQSPGDMEFAKGTTPQMIPVMLDVPNLNTDIWRDIPALQADWRVITGQSGARLSDPDSDTATEASFVERAGNLRDADMQDAINDWLSEAGRKMLQRIRATLTMDLWIKLRGFSDTEFQQYVERVYGKEVMLGIQFLPGLKEIYRERFGQEKWQRVTRESLQFEADVSVVPGSSRPRNLEVERSQWIQFLQIIGQFPQLALSRELLRETAAKFEYISERMLDELTALAQQMVNINANQAGRTQGGANASAQPQGGDGMGMLANMLASVTGGRQ